MPNKEELNARLSIKKNGKYENLYVTLEDGTSFEVKYAFYNRKLAYKVKKTIEK